MLALFPAVAPGEEGKPVLCRGMFIRFNPDFTVPRWCNNDRNIKNGGLPKG
jgi:hypothetical protein